MKGFWGLPESGLSVVRSRGFSL